MIKLWLKHWIYERCINVIFDAIKINFGKLEPSEFVDLCDELEERATFYAQTQDIEDYEEYTDLMWKLHAIRE